MPDGAPQLPYSRWRLRGAAALAGLLLFGATAGLPADDLAERLRAAVPDTAVQAVAYDGDRPVGHPTEMNWLSDGPGWNLRGNGGLLTNAASLARWLQAVAQGRVLPPEWQERQLERHAAKGDDSWYGYGWGVDQRDYGEVVGHTGGNGYFFALAFWYRDHDLLLAVTNNAFDREQAGLLLGNLRRALELEPAAAEGRVGQPQ
jgi:CubicO group peptidase (beta-lactamase class C family)